MSVRRATSKSTLGPEDWKTVHRSTPLGLGSSSSASAPTSFVPREPDPSGEKPSIAEIDTEEYTPSLPPDDAVNDYAPDESADHHPEAPDPKKPRLDEYDLKWIEQLETESKLEVNTLDLHQALMEVEDVPFH